MCFFKYTLAFMNQKYLWRLVNYLQLFGYGIGDFPVSD